MEGSSLNCPACNGLVFPTTDPDDPDVLVEKHFEGENVWLQPWHRSCYEKHMEANEE